MARIRRKLASRLTQIPKKSRLKSLDEFFDQTAFHATLEHAELMAKGKIFSAKRCSGFEDRGETSKGK